MVQNVWRHWTIDSEEDNKRIWNSEIEAESFKPSVFIKQPEDLEACLEIMLDNFEWIKIYQLELLVGSEQYP